MNSRKRNISIILSVLSLFMIITSAFTTQKVEADSNPASWVLCKFEDGEMIYNAATTDLIPYTFRSKSALTSSDSINNPYNAILSLAGFDFNEVNEAILGREVEPRTYPEDSAGANDKAPKVSLFDRFGMAGLRWSSYAGEWKYYYINACSNAETVSKTNYGKFYEDRLEPKSTYNEVGTSRDPRSQQFTRGVFANWTSAASDIFANMLFTISKIVLTLTITMVGLSFTDVTTLIGFSSSGSGVDPSGLFIDIFNGVFKGFVLLTFGLTAIYLLWNGLVKRQFRLALNTALRTVIIFVLAIVMASNPSFWISAPNKAATYGQALVLSSMSSIYTKNSDTSLCSSDVGKIINPDKLSSNISEAQLKGEFAQISRNMQSAIGCSLWEQMLFRPWVLGQFGVPYEDLDASRIKNVNEEWVGRPEVPVGGGQTIDNWAAFHLSTQTNAHSQLGDVNIPKYVNGVNVDWWRVVDALSNYDEEQIETEPVGDVGSLTYSQQKDTDTTPVWEYWVGNHRAGRAGVAFLSILFAIIGSIGPLIFGLSSAVYGIGITILMVVSPVFMLMGTWGGTGDGKFKGWLEALISTIGKKLATSILLIFSLTLTMTGMDLVNEIGWITSFILISVVTMVFVKNRRQILESMTSVDFGGVFNPRQGFNRALEKHKSRSKRVTSIAQGAAGGAVAAHETGRNVMEGMKSGAMEQFKNTLYQTEFGREVAYAQERVSPDEKDKAAFRYCRLCGAQIVAEHREAYRDEFGNYYCAFCGAESDAKLDKIKVDAKEMETEDDGKIRDTYATLNQSWLSHGKAKELMEANFKYGELEWNNENVEKMIEDNIKRLHTDIVVFKFSKERLGDNAMPPSIPEPLQDYLNMAVMYEAWTDERYEFIDTAYRTAWKEWHEDNASLIANVDEDEAKKFRERILEVQPEIDPNYAIKSYAGSKDFVPRDDELYDEEFAYRFDENMELQQYEIEEEEDDEENVDNTDDKDVQRVGE